MKKFFFFAALAAVLTTACNKNGSFTGIPDRTAEVSFSLSTAALGTRAAPVEADEVRVNTVDAFVFNETGDLDAYGHFTGEDFTTDATTQVTSLKDGKKLSCTTGSGKKIWIVINGNDANVTNGYSGGVTTEASLKSQVFLLTQNARTTGNTLTLDNFQMIGSATAALHPGDNTVSVEVSRPVARVWIKKITKDFTSPAQAGALTVKNIYMSNVVGSCLYDGTTQIGANNLWFNKYDNGAAGPSVAIDQEGNPWLNRGLSPAVSIAEGASKTTEIESTFYVMPNNVPWGTGTPAVFGPTGGAAWSPRHTRLVIETEYAGTTYYYGIPIADNGTKGYPIGKDGDDGSTYSGLNANYSYEIDELVLTRLGSTSPDEPVIPSMVNFSITVAGWTTKLLTAGDAQKYVI